MILRLRSVFVFVSVWIFTDVGMMMMQTGMVKQSLNTYRTCLNGTETKNKYYVLPYLTQYSLFASTNNAMGEGIYANTQLNDTRS